jgi:hypothetical protein
MVIKETETENKSDQFEPAVYKTKAAMVLRKSLTFYHNLKFAFDFTLVSVEPHLV